MYMDDDDNDRLLLLQYTCIAHLVAHCSSSSRRRSSRSMDWDIMEIQSILSLCESVFTTWYFWHPSSEKD